MNINEIVKAKFLTIDDEDESEIDWFMSQIETTDEYRNDVINHMDFDFDDLLHAIASDGDVDEEIDNIHNQIRSNARDLYQKVMVDVVQDAKDEEDAHGDYLHDLQVQARIDND